MWFVTILLNLFLLCLHNFFFFLSSIWVFFFLAIADLLCWHVAHLLRWWSYVLGYVIFVCMRGVCLYCTGHAKCVIACVLVARSYISDFVMIVSSSECASCHALWSGMRTKFSKKIKFYKFLFLAGDVVGRPSGGTFPHCTNCKNSESWGDVLVFHWNRLCGDNSDVIPERVYMI